MGRRALGHSTPYGHRLNRADVSPWTSKDAIVAARAAGRGHGRRPVVSRHHALWLVREGLCHIHRGLWIAERGDCAAGMALYRFCDCAAGRGDERTVVSENGGVRKQGQKGMTIPNE